MSRLADIVVALKYNGSLPGRPFEPRAAVYTPFEHLIELLEEVDADTSGAGAEAEKAAIRIYELLEGKPYRAHLAPTGADLIRAELEEAADALESSNSMRARIRGILEGVTGAGASPVPEGAAGIVEVLERFRDALEEFSDVLSLSCAADAARTRLMEDAVDRVRGLEEQADSATAADPDARSASAFEARTMLEAAEKRAAELAARLETAERAAADAAEARDTARRERERADTLARELAGARSALAYIEERANTGPAEPAAVPAPPGPAAVPTKRAKTARRAPSAKRAAADRGIGAAAKTLFPAAWLDGSRAVVTDGETAYVAPLEVTGWGRGWSRLESLDRLDVSAVRASRAADGSGSLVGADGMTRALDAVADGNGPEVPGAGEGEPAGMLDRADLAMLEAVRYAVSADESKPDIRGFAFDRGHVYSTDGRRLSFRRLEGMGKPEGLAIEAGAVRLLAGAGSLAVRILPSDDEDRAPRALLVADDGRYVVTRLLTKPGQSTGGRQVFRGILETMGNESVYAPRAWVHAGELETALKTVAPIARKASETIMMTFEIGGAVAVEAVASSVGRQVVGVRAREVRPVDAGGGAYAVAINRAYLLDAVRAAAGDADGEGFVQWRSVSNQKAQLIGNGEILMTIRTAAGR